MFFYTDLRFVVICCFRTVFRLFLDSLVLLSLFHLHFLHDLKVSLGCLVAVWLFLFLFVVFYYCLYIAVDICELEIDKNEMQLIKFNGKNYSAWAYQFELYLKGKKLWGHISGSLKKPTDIAKLDDWETKEAQIMSWMLGAVEPQFFFTS